MKRLALILGLLLAVPVSAQLAISTTSLAQGKIGTSYSASISATGGTPPYTFSISSAAKSGSLPPGLSIASSGAISGTPTKPGLYAANFQVTDSVPNTVTKYLTLMITDGPTLDQYGGRTDITCTNTGWFHTQEINKHWWLCDPLGNVFFSEGQENVGTAGAQASIHGTVDPMSVVMRTESWGFNTIGTYSAGYGGGDCVYAFCTNAYFPLDSNGLHTNPVKIPFIFIIRPVYAMWNTSDYHLTNLVKPQTSVWSPIYTGYKGSGGSVLDYYDPGIATWMAGELGGSFFPWNVIPTSPYANYMIGMSADDGDEMIGFKAGPDFTTRPNSGTNDVNLALEVAAMSPIQVAVANGGTTHFGPFLYSDTVMHSKIAWRDALGNEYLCTGSGTPVATCTGAGTGTGSFDPNCTGAGTPNNWCSGAYVGATNASNALSALNTAWSTSGTYTTWNSSGTCYGSVSIPCASSLAATSLGTGDGTTLTFSGTLNTTVAVDSLQILVAGSVVAGDTGGGAFYGPNVSSGSINYSTGAVSITFSAGHAPANGAAVTAAYMANAWQVGTGILDEDKRSGHSWLGTSWTLLTGMNANTKTDINAFYEDIAAQYFSTCRTAIKNWMPNIMYLGPDALDSYAAPSAAPVLKAAGQYIDAYITDDSYNYTQAMLDFVETNYGNKPFFSSTYTLAQQDSSQQANNPSGFQVPTYTTQTARSQAYYSQINDALNNLHTTDGNYLYVGNVAFLAYVDFQSVNWGTLTATDNAYDGHEAATGSVACSSPIAEYTCGSEPTPGSCYTTGCGSPPYNDAIGTVSNGLILNGNVLWQQVSGSSTPVIPAPTSLIAQVAKIWKAITGGL